ncbi:tight adherence pilus pseudopilin TadF [Vibrio hepatarius]|uniref:tight adherence pilus pseudopilin TadF n=1 Tax=Vibrio hepatarius TaxID=171383 RepID=UPI003736B785
MTIKTASKQRGVASIEFPFVVVGIMVIVFGLVSIYRLMYTQTRLDSTAFMLADIVARTFDDKGTTAPIKLKDLVNEQFDAQELLMIAQRMLPKGIASQSVGLKLEIRREDPASDRIESIPLFAGANCTAASSIESLSDLAPKSERDEKALKGRTATLVQATLCVENPFSLDSQFELTGFVLPNRLTSKAVMIGGRYAL